jgi:hypothetical protein
MNKLRIARGLCIVLCLAIALSSCNLPQSRPKTSPEMDVTQAFLTVEARLTEAAMLTPTANPTATDTPAPSPTVAQATSTSAPTKAPTANPGPSCDQAAAGNPIDVTIPDDTKMAPGQTFTKTWRLQNAGTCTWTTDYSIALFSGEAMGAPTSVSMPKNVAPGETVDISVDLVSPQTAGTYLGNWKLRNAANVWFGIGPVGGSPFWVKIIVSASTTVTPATPTLGTPGTPTVTSTTVPDVQVSGKKTLTPGDRLNLDNNTINSGVGEDVAWLLSADNALTLTPLGSAIIAIYGGTEPSLENCQATPMFAAPIPLEFLTEGLYLCYRTDLGLYGTMKMLNYKEAEKSLVFQFLTWAAP